MLKEYALDPELLSNWKEFRYFIEKFGVQYGRVISQYPSKWKKAVCEAIKNCPDVEKKRIIERLSLLDNRTIVSRVNEWNNSLDWLSNALQEHSKRPFHAIIAQQNVDNHKQVLTGDEVDDTHPLMQSPTTYTVSRKAEEMAISVRNLLRFSRKIIFIDPYFSGSSKRHHRPLEEFLNIIKETLIINPSKRVELEYHTNDLQIEKQFKEECEINLPSVIPVGLGLSIVRWNRKELHDRFILTNIGGVAFGIGLDDNNLGQGIPNVNVSFLAETFYQKLWKKHNNKMALLKIIGTKQKLD
jgi:hypothetical protein